jgi:hypothetical protein
MNSIFLVFKQDGTVYVSNRKEDLVGLTSTALRLELQALPPFGKICTITGNAGAYTVTSNTHHRDGQYYAPTF